jgi:transposase
MLAPHPRTDKPSPTRWTIPPWTIESPEWIRIDRSLADDHPARIAAQAVARLDLGPLLGTYAGLGSAAHPPALLLAVALYELDRGELSPAHWARDCRELDAAKWLTSGLTPSPSTMYAFRDRVGPLLGRLNRQVLERAIAAGLTTAEHAAGDGTFVAALGSRRRLVNAATLARRLDQLEAALAVEARGDGPAPPAPDHEPSTPAPGESAAAAEEPAARGVAALAAPPDPIEPPAGTEGGPGAAGHPVESGPAPAPAAAPGPAPPAWMARTPAGRRRQHRRYRRARREMERRLGHFRKTRSKRAKAQRRPDDRVLICPSEPEAVLGRDKLKVFRPLYNVQLARDLESPLILGYDVLPQANDAGCFSDFSGAVDLPRPRCHRS